MGDIATQRRLQTLVELSIDGDRDAFDAVYRQWHPRWRGFAIRHTGSVEVAEDVLQNAAVQMIRNLPRLKDAATFVQWSFVILRRCCADHVRAAVRSRNHEVQVAEPPSSEAAPPEDARLAPLSAAVAGLEPEQQNLLTLFYGYGLSVREIATVYEVPTGTIKSRLHTLRESIRATVLNEEE